MESADNRWRIVLLRRREGAHAAAKAELAARLMRELTAAGDPRVTGDGLTFERPPFSGPLPGDAGKGKKKAKAGD